MSLFEDVRDEPNLTVVGSTTPLPVDGDTLLAGLARAHAHAGVPESERRPLGEDIVRCPECDGAATIEWRSSAAGTNGPVEHVKVRCASGHWFLMPAAWLTEATA